MPRRSRISVSSRRSASHTAMANMPTNRLTAASIPQRSNAARITSLSPWPRKVAPGATFRGHGDSEVILAAFERWGIEAAVKRFVGMFAMAVWDAERRELTLIRDRLGIKPLFVYAEPGYVSFASELRALRAGPRFDPTLDVEAVTAYLRYLYVPAPATIFRRARKLLPGHLLAIRDPDAPLPEARPYW